MAEKSIFYICDFNSSELEKYINEGISTHIVRWDQTPVMRYVAEPRILKLLLKAPDCQVNAIDTNGNSAFLKLFEYPFYYSDEKNHNDKGNGSNFLECFNLLIEAGADVHLKNKFGHNALFKFLMKTRSSDFDFIFEKLINLGIDTNCVDDNGNTILHLASQFSLVKPLELILKTNPSLLNITNNNNYSPLMTLCYGNIPDYLMGDILKCVEILLTYKPILTFKTISSAQNLLQIENNITIDKSEYCGDTALQICYEFGHVELFKMLYPLNITKSRFFSFNRNQNHVLIDKYIQNELKI